MDDETFVEPEKVKLTYPLYVLGAIRGVKNAMAAFPDVPVMTMSDSEALTGGSRKDTFYALPAEIVEEFDFGRWGAHGSLYGYVMGKIKELGILEKKMVVCHLGSGCSVTAFIDGEPVYTLTSGTPLEGLISSTRTSLTDPTVGALLGEKAGDAYDSLAGIQGDVGEMVDKFEEVTKGDLETRNKAQRRSEQMGWSWA